MLLSCTSITVRPNIRPFPLAAFDTVLGQPAPVVEAARAGAAALGLEVSAFSAPEGYLETRWFHVGTRRSQRYNSDPTHLVRLRVWTDLVTPRETQVVVETVYRRTIDPSVPDHEVEWVVDPGTPGDSLTQAVRAAVKRQFGARSEKADTTGP